jgi:hypothetical protein
MIPCRGIRPKDAPCQERSTHVAHFEGSDRIGFYCERHVRMGLDHKLYDAVWEIRTGKPLYSALIFALSPGDGS